MKAEKEIIWLIDLRDSEFVQGWFRAKSGSKKDFERLLGAPNNSKEFSIWFNEMRDDGIIVLSEEAGDGTQHDKFMVDKKICDQKIKENRHNKILHKYYNKDTVIKI